MSNKLVALLFGVGAAGWVYSQMMRRTGNTKTSVYVAIGGGLIAAFVIYTLFAIVFKAPDSDGTGGGL